MVWYSHLFNNFPQFVVIHLVKGFSVVSEIEVNIFLKFCCFFYDPADVGNLISGSSAFSKSSLNIWKPSVHLLLKPGFSNTSTMNFQMFIVVLQKSEEQEIKLPTSTGSWKKQESSIKTSISALVTVPKPLTVWITINCGKF